MRHATTTRLERLFAVILATAAPAALGAMACGGVAETPGAGLDGGSSSGASSGTSSGTGSSGAGSSGTGSSGTGSSGAGSSGTGSSGASSGTGSSGAGSSGTGSSSGSGSGSSSGACNSGFPGCACQEFVLDGGVPDAAAYDAGGYFTVEGGLPYTECQELCSPNWGPVNSCVVASAGPPAVVACRYVCVGGRRPADLQCAETGARSGPGAWLASLAQLEGASVPAFRRMARELARHGAPKKLVKAAERAAREEVRHARAATALAKRFGARVAGFEAGARSERSLEEIATENAVEGCVRETYGALVAAWQAREARDPQVKAHMARIAKEETSHAALAWKTDAWARGRLGREARARVEAARRQAARALMNEILGGGPSLEGVGALGLPDARTAAALASQLAEALAA